MSLFESIYRFFGWWIINIDMLFIFFLILGGALLFFKKMKWGRRCLVFGCGGLVFFAVVPVGLWTFEHLENRFPKIQQIPAGTKGMILLGGSFDKMTTLARKETAYNLNACNFITFVEIAKAHPHLQLVYTGNAFEAETAKKEFQALGLEPATIQFEGNSKNTLENAGKTKEMLNPTPQDQWILVASAYHIPRATGLFRKAGFHVIPYPVDYHTPGNYEPWFFIGLKMNLDAWHASSREWLGMFANYIMGRSAELFSKATMDKG